MYIYLVQQKKGPKNFFHMTPQIGPLCTGGGRPSVDHSTGGGGLVWTTALVGEA